MCMKWKPDWRAAADVIEGCLLAALVGGSALAGFFHAARWMFG